MRVRGKPEFVYEDCVKLIGHGGVHKHSCALKSRPIRNTCSMTNFLPTSPNTCLKLKIKNSFKVKWMKLWRIFFPTNVCFLMWSIEGVNKSTRRRHFLWQKFLLRECLCVRNVIIIYRGHLFYFRFMESYCLFTDSLFGRFSFEEWYGPDGRYDSCSISNTHGVKLSRGVINT